MKLTITEHDVDESFAAWLIGFYVRIVIGDIQFEGKIDSCPSDEGGFVNIAGPLVDMEDVDVRAIGTFSVRLNDVDELEIY